MIESGGFSENSQPTIQPVTVGRVLRFNNITIIATDQLTNQMTVPDENNDIITNVETQAQDSEEQEAFAEEEQIVEEQEPDVVEQNGEDQEASKEAKGTDVQERDDGHESEAKDQEQELVEESSMLSDTSVNEAKKLWRTNIAKVKETSSIVSAIVMMINGECYKGEEGKEQLVQVVCCDVALNLLYENIPILTQSSLNKIMAISKTVYNLGGSPQTPPALDDNPTGHLFFGAENYFSRRFSAIIRYCDKYSSFIQVENPVLENVDSRNYLIQAIIQAGYGLDNKEKKQQVCAIFKVWNWTKPNNHGQYYVVHYDGLDNICIFTTEDRPGYLGMLNVRALFFPTIDSLAEYLAFDEESSISNLILVEKLKEAIVTQKPDEPPHIAPWVNKLSEDYNNLREEFLEELSSLNVAIQKDIHVLNNQTIELSALVQQTRLGTETDIKELFESERENSDRLDFNADKILECEAKVDEVSEHSEKCFAQLKERVEVLEKRLAQKDEEIKVLQQQVQWFTDTRLSHEEKYREKENQLIERMTQKFEEESNKFLEMKKWMENEYTNKFLELLAKQKLLDIRGDTPSRLSDTVKNYSPISDSYKNIFSQSPSRRYFSRSPFRTADEEHSPPSIMDRDRTSTLSDDPAKQLF